VRKADNLTTILCRCHENLGTLNSWKPLGHSRPVTGLLLISCTSGFSFLINNRSMVEKRIGLRGSLLICFIKWSPSNNGILKYVVAGSVTLLYRWLPSPLSHRAARLKERERNNSGNITTTRRASRIFSCSFDSLMSR